MKTDEIKFPIWKASLTLPRAWLESLNSDFKAEYKYVVVARPSKGEERLVRWETYGEDLMNRNIVLGNES